MGADWDVAIASREDQESNVLYIRMDEDGGYMIEMTGYYYFLLYVHLFRSK